MVRTIMSQKVVTIEPEMAMLEAGQRMKEHNIRHLCVVKGEKLVGIVTDSDIKEASPSDATSLSVYELTYLLSKVKIKEIMTKDPITVEADKTIEDAAAVMMKKHVSALPVVDKSELVGIITESDIFKALAMLTGVHLGGDKVGLELKDEPGSIKEAADIFREHGGRMVSILTSYEDAREGFRNVYIRVKGLESNKLPELEKELRSKFRVLYIQKAEKQD